MQRSELRRLGPPHRSGEGELRPKDLIVDSRQMGAYNPAQLPRRRLLGEGENVGGHWNAGSAERA
jgi:hypothetical protein